MYFFFFCTTREMHVFESLNLEQELSLWLYLLQHSGCAQGLAYPFSVVTLFCFLESLSWNRKPDVLFTGLSAWDLSDCAWELLFFCHVCGGWDKVCAMICLCDMTFGPSRFLFCLVLFWLDTDADPFSPSVLCARVEVLTPQLLCLAAVWLSGFFFLPSFVWLQFDNC